MKESNLAKLLIEPILILLTLSILKSYATYLIVKSQLNVEDNILIDLFTSFGAVITSILVVCYILLTTYLTYAVILITTIDEKQNPDFTFTNFIKLWYYGFVPQIMYSIILIFAILSNYNVVEIEAEYNIFTILEILFLLWGTALLHFKFKFNILKSLFFVVFPIIIFTLFKHLF